MFDRRLVQNFDWVLLLLVLAICGIGIVNLYSAGYNRPAGETPLYIKQLYWLGLGLGVLFLILLVDYRHLEKLSYPIYILSILLLVGVMFGGKVVYGSRRWLALGPFSFQPSELAKLGIILAAGAMAGAAALSQLAVAFHRSGIPEEKIGALHKAIEDGKYLVMLRGAESEIEQWRDMLAAGHAESIDNLPYTRIIDKD